MTCADVFTVILILQAVSVHLRHVHCGGQSMCMKAFITSHLTLTNMSSTLRTG